MVAGVVPRVSSVPSTRPGAVTKHERYNRSEKGRARYARYRQTEKGHANERRMSLRQDVREREKQITRIEEALASPSTT